MFLPHNRLSLRITAHSHRICAASWLTHKMSLLMGQMSLESSHGMDPIVPIWKDVPASASQTANP